MTGYAGAIELMQSIIRGNEQKEKLFHRKRALRKGQLAADRSLFERADHRGRFASEQKSKPVQKKETVKKTKKPYTKDVSFENVVAEYDTNDLFYPHNLTNFHVRTYDSLKNLKHDMKLEVLKHYQFLPYKYMTLNPRTRGLFIYHQTGYGKTFLAVAIADKFLDEGVVRKVIFMSPKALLSNFSEAVVKFRSMVNAKKKKKMTAAQIGDLSKFNLITMNNVNSFEALSKAANIEQEASRLMEIDRELSAEHDHVLLIVDEVHNLLVGISNESPSAMQIYLLIMRLRKVKILFLSGTPIINSPWEIALAFNMLRGQEQDPIDRRWKTPFGTDPELFARTFLNDARTHIKNRALFQNRITGLVTYYGDMYNLALKHNTEFPVRLEDQIIRVHMSHQQFTLYSTFRRIEQIQSARSDFSNRGSSTSRQSFRVKSRMASNFLFADATDASRLLAEEQKAATARQIAQIENKKRKRSGIVSAKDLKEMKSKVYQFGNKSSSMVLTIPPNAYNNLETYSPKLLRLIQNVEKYPKRLHVVYSNYVKDGGIKSIATCLTYRGYAEIMATKTGYKFKPLVKDFVNNEFVNQTPSTSKLRFMRVTGQETKAQIQHNVRLFSEERNARGAVANVLLLSGAGSEGIDLKNVRYVHVLEYFWNKARIEQVIARGLRLRSHNALKPKERNLQAIVYMATYPKEMKKSLRPETFTTDEHVYISANKKEELAKEFLKAIRESAIDCQINVKLSKIAKNKIRCRMCIPNNTKLYDLDVSSKERANDPCIPLDLEDKKNKVDLKLKKTSFKGVTYFYKFEHKESAIPKVYKPVFEGSHQLVEMLAGDPLYKTIVGLCKN